MKADQTGIHSAAKERRGRLVDFLFVGAGVLPLALMLAGQFAPAILLFVPLLLAGCLFGAWEQIGIAPDEGAGPEGRSAGSPPSATGVNLRNRLGNGS